MDVVLLENTHVDFDEPQDNLLDFPATCTPRLNAHFFSGLTTNFECAQNVRRKRYGVSAC